MAVTYTDTFTDTNGTLLSAHTADTSQTYTAASTFEIQGNELESTAAGTVFAYVDQTQVYSSTFEYSVVLSVASGATAKHGPAACLDGDISYWCRFDPVINEIQLYKTETGSVSTKLGAWDYGSWTGPISIDLMLFVDASNVKVSVDGTERISVADTDVPRSGDIGYRFFGNTGVSIDSASFDADPGEAINPDSPTLDGETGIALNKSDFIGALTGVTVDGVAVSFTQTTYDNLDVASIASDAGTAGPKFGTVQVVASNATESASADSVLNPKVTDTVVDVATPDTVTANSIASLMLNLASPLTVITTDQFLYDNTDGSVIYADTNWSFPDIATTPKTFYYYDITAKTWRALTMTASGLGGGRTTTKQAVTPGVPWLPNLTVPYANQSYRDGIVPSGVLIERTEFEDNTLPAGWTKNANTAIANNESVHYWPANAYATRAIWPRANSGIDGSTELYVKIRVKHSMQAGGCKMIKAHGQEQDLGGGAGSNYANWTIGGQYSTGNIVDFGFGDGTGEANDQAAIIDFATGNAIGRNAGNAIVNCPEGIWVWPDTEYHEFKIHFKFNSGNSPETEVSDGEIHLYIDDVLYCEATNLFNRHYSNLPTNYMEFLSYSQENSEFTMNCNLIEISSGDWL